ncbi:MAG: hypothetical protein EOO87_13275 [Pedobacter sp.]|nr:MAG: hypothetical protein EOO87_13275 [Pedobacter sp.]
MKRSFILFLLSLCGTQLLAQNKTVQGFVVDAESKNRLAKVYIYNPASDEGIYNNAKGEFSTVAKLGDTIFAALPGYGMDTVVYKGQAAIVFQLKSLGIRLKEVKITGKIPTPAEAYANKQKEFKYALDRGSSKDLLNLSQRGVGLGIDAIYNLLSRQGKNARHLQSILEKDYREEIIDFRYRKDYVKNLVDIPEADLNDFMLQYRPTYTFVLTASEYAFINFITNSYASYKRNPSMFRLPALPRYPIPPQGQ